MERRHTFKRSRRISSKIKIQELFRSQVWVFSYPLKAIYKTDTYNEKSPVSYLISVPKASWKRAVDRNSLKRKIREAVRKSNSEIETYCNQHHFSIQLAIIFIGKKAEPYHIIFEAVQEVHRKVLISHGQNQV